jgi:hypothetical protein
MRKFKVKNRRKRKYVRKQELATSLSQAQSLTLGVIPVLLIAIAFFATFMIGNPQMATSALADLRVGQPSLPDLPQISLPQISVPQISLPDISVPAITMPKITFSFDLPDVSLPAIAVPEVTFPHMPSFSLPQITMPDLLTPITTLFIATGRTLTGAINTGLDDIDNLGNFLGHSISHTSSDLWKGLVGVSYATVHGLTVAGKAIIDGLNAFFWVLGTPFRYIGSVMHKFVVAITPFVTYINHAFAAALNQLKEGGNTLIKGANTVSSTMAPHK